MNKLEKIYLELLLEAQFENKDFKRFDIYRGIEIYYNYEHVKQRLQERYQDINFSLIRKLIKALIKNILKNNNLKDIEVLNFVCKFIISEVWIAGRFKKNFGKWRVEINTVLPKNPTFPTNICYMELDR